jgi:SAM-dependent methyltransferase
MDNGKHSSLSPSSVPLPASWVVRHAPLIAPGGRVLDLACGSGRNVIWLAAQGFRVLAVDRDRRALESLQGGAIVARCVDLEGPEWPLADETFDGIVVTRYLHRPRLPELVGSLAIGGVFIYETFMRGNEAYGSPRRPEFLLESGELKRLAEAFGLEIVAYREGLESGERPAVTQSLCARRV